MRGRDSPCSLITLSLSLPLGIHLSQHAMLSPEGNQIYISTGDLSSDPTIS